MGMRADNGAEPFLVGPVTVEPMRNRLSLRDARTAVEPKMMDLLVEMASEPNVVRSRSDLIDKVWGVSFGSDESLTRAVSGLRHAFAQVAPDVKFIETVSKRGYRLVAAVSSLPPSAPEGRTAFAKSKLFRPPKRLVLGLAAIVLGVLLTAAYALLRTDNSAPRFDRIAVGPITAAQGNGSATEMAGALQEALLRELALGGVEAIPESPSASTPLRISGSFSEIDGQDVVTINVEERKTGQPLWARQFELGDNEWNIVRDQVPWVVGSAVSCGVLGNKASDGQDIGDPVLVGFFIRGCNEFRNNGDFANLLVYTERARVYAPESAVTKVRYAIAAAWSSIAANSDDERDRLIGKAREAADSVIAAEPEYGVAHYALGIANWSARDWHGADAELRTAYRLAPDYPYTLNALGNLAFELGYIDEELDLRRRAMVADHFSLAQPARLAIILAERGRLAEARKLVERIRPLSAQRACMSEFYIELWWGDAKDAHRLLAGPCVGSTLPRAGAACAADYLDYRVGVRPAGAVLRSCKDMPLRDALQYAVATGQLDEAVQLVAARDTHGLWPSDLFLGQMRPLRDDARFMEIASRFGVTRFWIESGRWPDFCSEDALPYDCREAAMRAERALESGPA